jgi:hypothetical protein
MKLGLIKQEDNLTLYPSFQDIAMSDGTPVRILGTMIIGFVLLQATYSRNTIFRYFQRTNFPITFRKII